MLNKIAILIITYNTHELTEKLVNQLKYYNSDLYDLTVIDNSVNNYGFDQTVIKWLEENKKNNYLGYWLINNDIELDINFNYLEKFIEYINLDDTIGIISTKITDDLPYIIPQKFNYDKPMLVNYVDFQSSVITKHLINKLNFNEANYFFGGLDLDICINALKNNLKILIDYRFSVYHKFHQSFNKKEPLEDLKKHLQKYNINIDINNKTFDEINSLLITNCLTKRYPEIQNRPQESLLEKCTSYKQELMSMPPIDYAEDAFITGMSYYKLNTYELSKIYFKRSICAGKREAVSYLAGAANFTYNYSNITNFLEKYVDRNTYELERQSYEYIKAQETHFNINRNSRKKFVFYVKPDAGHKWDPLHTDVGVGGSEIAVINLSKELAKLGQDVVVFNNCKEPGIYDNVKWDSISNFDKYEKNNIIDILIVSRLPEFRFVNPRTKVYFWAHDLNYYERITPANWQYFDKFLVLSRYHFRFFSSAYPWIPKENFEILPNGVDLKRFNQKVDRNDKKLIYSSNPDRGLVILFDIFEELYKWDPKLELHVFGYYPENVRKHPTYWKEMPGVIYRGYHNQEELAREYLSSKLWLYPCTWLETYCITALEAQAAGTPAVVSEWGPLRDRIGNAGIVIDGFEKDDKHKEKFVEAVKNLLTDQNLWNELSLNGRQQVKFSTWEHSATKLIEISNKCRY